MGDELSNNSNDTSQLSDSLSFYGYEHDSSSRDLSFTDLSSLSCSPQQPQQEGFNFGSTSTGSNFGGNQATTRNTCGQTNTTGGGLFENNAAKPGGLFGSTTTTTTGRRLFGAQPQATTGGLFGSTTQALQPLNTGFGNVAQPQVVVQQQVAPIPIPSGNFNPNSSLANQSLHDTSVVNRTIDSAIDASFNGSSNRLGVRGSVRRSNSKQFDHSVLAESSRVGSVNRDSRSVDPNALPRFAESPRRSDVVAATPQVDPVQAVVQRHQDRNMDPPVLNLETTFDEYTEVCHQVGRATQETTLLESNQERTGREGSPRASAHLHSSGHSRPDQWNLGGVGDEEDEERWWETPRICAIIPNWGRRRLEHVYGPHLEMMPRGRSALDGNEHRFRSLLNAAGPFQMDIEPAGPRHFVEATPTGRRRCEPISDPQMDIKPVGRNGMESPEHRPWPLHNAAGPLQMDIQPAGPGNVVEVPPTGRGRCEPIVDPQMDIKPAGRNGVERFPRPRSNRRCRPVLPPRSRASGAPVTTAVTDKTTIAYTHGSAPTTQSLHLRSSTRHSSNGTSPNGTSPNRTSPNRPSPNRQSPTTLHLEPRFAFNPNDSWRNEDAYSKDLFPLTGQELEEYFQDQYNVGINQNKRGQACGYPPLMCFPIAPPKALERERIVERRRPTHFPRNHAWTRL